MGRTLPQECHHGTTIDWGDFGPHQNGCEDECFEPDGRCPDHPTCDLCDQEEQRTEEVRWTLIGDAIRGFLMEKHVPFDVMDEWTDEVVAIVREHLAPPTQSGRTDSEGEPCPRCGHRLSAYDWCPSCLAHVSGSDTSGDAA